MYYTVYKVTNQISGKVYIGTHKTKNLDDGYMGSGKYLKRAIERHGIKNFTKEILFVFDNPEDMFSKEAEIVTEEFISEENTYNLKIGGFGGFDFINKKYPKSPIYGKKLTEHTKSLMRHRAKEQHRIDNAMNALILANKNFLELKIRPFLGKKHKEESKRLISKHAKQRLSDPTKNSQYGSMWITNGTENKKIKMVDLIPEGWYKGRVIKTIAT